MSAILSMDIHVHVHVHVVFAQTTVTEDLQQAFPSICFPQCSCGAKHLDLVRYLGGWN
jgi:hypothetical protein